MQLIKKWFPVFHINDESYIICGTCYDHNKANPQTTEFQDGHRICTSPVMEFSDNYIIRTRSGSEYKLEDQGSDSDWKDFPLNFQFRKLSLEKFLKEVKEINNPKEDQTNETNQTN